LENAHDMIRHVVIGGVLLCTVSCGIASKDASAAKVTVAHVAGRVHMLTGEGGNIGVSAGEDGILMVDDQFARLSGEIRAALTKVHPGAPRYLINTHWHYDHTNGNTAFAEEATILAHANVRQRLSTTQVIRRLNKTVEPLPDAALPVITFDDAVTVHFNGEAIHVRHLPRGHTDGDSIVWFPESRVVHMGDQFFNGLYPFIDVESGGSVDGVIRNVASVLQWLPPDAKVIPGHGPLGDRDALQTYYQLLVETAVLVRQAISAGKSLADIQAAGMPDRWSGWSHGFLSTDTWLSIVYDSLTQP
jgi:cyclase